MQRAIKNFSEFMNEAKQQRDTAGIAIVYEDKILLVHPTNGSWVKPIMGIPKGKIENGEDSLDAAIRETFEETGIKVDGSKFPNSPNTVEVYDKSGNFRNIIYYYEYHIKSLSEIGLETISVPKGQLQAIEIDWAGFVDIKEAYSKVASAQRIILDRLS